MRRPSTLTASSLLCLSCLCLQGWLALRILLLVPKDQRPYRVARVRYAACIAGTFFLNVITRGGFGGDLDLEIDPSRLLCPFVSLLASLPQVLANTSDLKTSACKCAAKPHPLLVSTHPFPACHHFPGVVIAMPECPHHRSGVFLTHRK